MAAGVEREPPTFGGREGVGESEGVGVDDLGRGRTRGAAAKVVESLEKRVVRGVPPVAEGNPEREAHREAVRVEESGLPLPLPLPLTPLPLLLLPMVQIPSPTLPSATGMVAVRVASVDVRASRTAAPEFPPLLSTPSPPPVSMEEGVGSATLVEGGTKEAKDATTPPEGVPKSLQIPAPMPLPLPLLPLPLPPLITLPLPPPPPLEIAAAAQRATSVHSRGRDRSSAPDNPSMTP